MLSVTGFLQSVLLAFVPLFVAMDALGTTPLFLTFPRDLPESARKRLVRNSTLTAFGVALLFLFAGKALFRFLGITADDFRIGGGIVLLILAIKDILFPEKEEAIRAQALQMQTSAAADLRVQEFGAVPIGIPLIMGPAALTAIIILVDNYGYAITLASLILNTVFVWLIFRFSHVIFGIIGESGAKIFGKISALFMVAIAIMMIRIGITNFI